MQEEHTKHSKQKKGHIQNRRMQLFTVIFPLCSPSTLKTIMGHESRYGEVKLN